MAPFPIDAVVAWVDGNDPAHRAKLLQYAGGEDLSRDCVASPTRFSDLGEIKICIASIRRFAPFVRNIFVLTDGQDPHIEGVTLVDHRDIYRGYEEFLPVFCSRSFETLLWRIPGLAEHYIYFNDDIILRRPCGAEDFFPDGKALHYAHPFSIAAVMLLRRFKPAYKWGYKDCLAEAAALAGCTRSFLYLPHMPHPQIASVAREYFEAHPDVMLRNMRERFRRPGQFNPQALNAQLCIDVGEGVLRDDRGAHLYMKPRGGMDYYKKKLAKFAAGTGALSICVNSLDQAPEEGRRMVLEWLETLVGLR